MRLHPSPPADRPVRRGRVRSTALAAAVLLSGLIALVPDGPARAADPVTGTDGSPMILEYEVSGARRVVTLPLGFSDTGTVETVRVAVDWGDTAPRVLEHITTQGVHEHTYDGAFGDGTATVRIWPLYGDETGGSNTGPWLTLYGANRDGDEFSLPPFKASAAADDPDAARLIGVTSFGELGTTSLRNAFNSHHALAAVPAALPATVTDLGHAFFNATTFNGAGVTSWNVTDVTDMINMFRRARVFNQDISGWNVADVTDMSGMFQDADAFNQDIGGWNVANVTDMNSMFRGTDAFNQDISGWNVANVTDMSSMFGGTDAFNQDIGSWNVANVTDMSRMFDDAIAFNQDIGGWNVANVTDMGSMFAESPFNRNIGGWNVGSVTDMEGMFADTTAFDQPIGTWDVSSVTTMESMFNGAAAFDQDISGWDVRNVVRMNGMFLDAPEFDQPIGTWDVRNVDDMDEMFANATSFDRSLGDWSLNAGVDLAGMLDGSGMSSSCYDATLIGWAALDPAVTGRSLDADGLNYSPAGAAARATLVDVRSWTIDDDTATLDTATGRCATGTDTVSPASSSGPAVSCTPVAPSPGATVSCEVVGGDPDLDILWRAADDSGALTEGAVRLGADGRGRFTFTADGTTVGRTLTIELVAWTPPTVVATVGRAAPTSIPAGGGSVTRLRPPTSVLPLGLLVVLLALPLTGRPTGGRRVGGRR